MSIGLCFINRKSILLASDSRRADWTNIGFSCREGDFKKLWQVGEKTGLITIGGLMEQSDRMVDYYTLKKLKSRYDINDISNTLSKYISSEFSYYLR